MSEKSNPTNFFEIIANWSLADFDQYYPHSSKKYLPGNYIGSFHCSLFPHEEGSVFNCHFEEIEIKDKENALTEAVEIMSQRPITEFNFINETLNDKTAELVNEVTYSLQEIFEPVGSTNRDRDQLEPSFTATDAVLCMATAAHDLARALGLVIHGPFTAKEVFKSPLVDYLLYLPSRGLYPALIGVSRQNLPGIIS
jgi:hypothetical protein